MRSELEQLRLFIAVADSGSFTATALERNVEVSAISRAVRDLEASLGATLFERCSRGVILTAAGTSYVASARDILDRFDHARHAARRAARAGGGSLTIGFLWSATSKPMIELLQDFALDCPYDEIHIIEAGNDDLAARVRSGRIDLAIVVTDPPPMPRARSLGSLANRPLWLEPLAAVLPRSWSASSICWGDLTDTRLFCRAIDDWPRFTEFVRNLSGVELRFEPQEISQEGILGLVEAGLGACLVPTSLGHLLPDGIQLIPITSAGAVIQVEAVWSPANQNRALACLLRVCDRLYGPSPTGF